MKLVIEEKLKEQFEPIIGVIRAKGIDNSKELSEIDDLFTEVLEKVKKDFANLENPQSHPNLAAWREAYRAFGIKPKENRCSAEALIRRTLNDNPPSRINTLVDLYNYISLKYVLPVGGEDTATIVGDLQLAFATGEEEFIALGSDENKPPKEGEVIYKDDKGVICRCWNWREADRTKLTKETKNVVIVIDAIPPTSQETVQEALDELAALIEKYCGGTLRSEIFT